MEGQCLILADGREMNLRRVRLEWRLRNMRVKGIGTDEPIDTRWRIFPVPVSRSGRSCRILSRS